MNSRSARAVISAQSITRSRTGSRRWPHHPPCRVIRTIDRAVDQDARQVIIKIIVWLLDQQPYSLSDRACRRSFGTSGVVGGICQPTVRRRCGLRPGVPLRQPMRAALKLLFGPVTTAGG
jgi:hypothetical protein